MIDTIITNNPLVNEELSEKYNVEFYEESYIDILIRVRDKVHKGHILLTHPLSGSVKPNETPYKSIAISNSKKTLDMKSLMIIEESIGTAKKFIEGIGLYKWSCESIEDFKIVDLSIIKKALNI